VRAQLPYKFTPRPYQRGLFKAFLEDGQKRGIVVAHRRWGKDKCFLNLLAMLAIQTKANYAYYFPTAVLGRKALWDNIDVRTGMKVVDHLPPEIVEKKNEQQMKITLCNGSMIQVLGTDTLDVVGGNYFGVIFSECGQHNPLAWDYTRPILRENGGWALFNGTPRGKNWFYGLFNANRNNPKWFTSYQTIEDTGALTTEDLDEERRAGMSEAIIKQEYFCDWSVAVQGAIFAGLLEKARDGGRVSEAVEWNRAFPVFSSWDIGAPLNQRVWLFQIIEDRIVFLESLLGGSDCATPAEWAARLKGRAYRYEAHFIPHDAATENGGLWEGALKEAGLKGVTPVVRQNSVWDGINLAIDAFPRVHFSELPCKAGIEALDEYHSKQEPDGCTIKDVPVHNWASHFADAFSLAFQAIHAREHAGVPGRFIPQGGWRAEVMTARRNREMVL
jgi:hypothetical protein